MVDLHPSVAVLSELLISLDFHGKFGEREVSGEALAGLLDCGLESTGVMKKIGAHLATPEITFDAAKAPAPIDPSRYRNGVLPDLMLLPLGLLFDWIAGRAGKTHWIERSGGSIASLPELVELFPEGRFLHLHRDPLDAALSMQAHHHFRLRAFQHYDLRTAGGIRWSDLDERDLNDGAPMSRKLRAIFDHPVPLDYFLQDWSDCILRGMRAVKDLAPEQYVEVTFEEMMSDPATVLRTIVDFFELPDEPHWIDRACALLRKGQAAHAVPSAEQTELLERHCHAAMVLLDRAPAAALYR